MARKMKRGTHGQKVECKVCHRKVDLSKSREDLTLVSRSYSSSGTLTDVKLMKHLGTYTCDRCVVLIELGLDPLDPRNAYVDVEAEPVQMELGA